MKKNIFILNMLLALMILSSCGNNNGSGGGGSGNAKKSIDSEKNSFDKQRAASGVQNLASNGKSNPDDKTKDDVDEDQNLSEKRKVKIREDIKEDNNSGLGYTANNKVDSDLSQYPMDEDQNLSEKRKVKIKEDIKEDNNSGLGYTANNKVDSNLSQYPMDQATSTLGSYGDSDNAIEQNRNPENSINNNLDDNTIKTPANSNAHNNLKDKVKEIVNKECNNRGWLSLNNDDVRRFDLVSEQIDQAIKKNMPNNTQ